MILFAHNKTSKWLDSLEISEKEKLYKGARIMALQIKEKFKARTLEIQTRNEESLLKKQQQAVARKQEKNSRKKIDY